MLVANFADLHFGKIKLEHTAAQWNRAIETCIERGVSVVTVAGDIVERASVGVQTMRHLYCTGEIVEKIKAPMLSVGRDLSFVLVAGDHDAPGASGRDCLSIFYGMPNVRCISEPALVSIKELTVFAFPWNWNPEQCAEEHLNELLGGWERYLTSGPSIFVAHLMVHLASFGGGRVMEEAPDSGKGKGVGKMTITRALLDRIAEKVTRVSLGDFHNRHDLTDGKGGYCGALCQTTFGESENQAGFEIWDTESGAVEFIELYEAPRYRQITVTSNEELAAVSVNPREFLHVDAVGFDMHRDIALTLEASAPDRVTVLPIGEKKERETRVEKVPEGITENYHECLNTVARAEAWGADELASHQTRLNELLADAEQDKKREITQEDIFPTDEEKISA